MRIKKYDSSKVVGGRYYSVQERLDFYKKRRYDSTLSGFQRSYCEDKIEQLESIVGH